MATNDDEEETLQKWVEKQLDEEEKAKILVAQLRGEIKKMKRETEDIELIEETTHRDEIEKMKHEAQDMRQIQETIHQYEIKKLKRRGETKDRELEIMKCITKTMQRKIETMKRSKELMKQIDKAERQQIHESYQSKSRKQEIKSDSSSNKKRRNVFTSHDYFYNINVPDDLQSFNINEVLEDNNYLNDNILNCIENYSNQFSTYPIFNKEAMQNGFDQLLANLLNTSNNSTTLKYLNTSALYYLENKFNPNCTFTYKNINIDIDHEEPCLQDFVVCLGNLIPPHVSLSEDSMIEGILQYLTMILAGQRREKIYGFLSNYTHIKFFYLKRKSDSERCGFFQSQELEMFTYSSETLSSIDASTTTENRRKLGVNKDTWKTFINFLTMNTDFYQYKGLKIDPNDDLLGDRYMITKKIGFGTSSMVYLLEKNEDNHSVDDLPHYVMKILKETKYSKCFLNEVKMAKKLKRFNDLNKFHLFFQDILYPLSSDKYLFYEKQLQRTESLSLVQSKQLIDIIHYLYDCRIIHRDVRPRNIMLDPDSNHIKLINFGFAFAFNTDNQGGRMRAIAPRIYATEPIYKLYLRVLAGKDHSYYFYERTFDLICAINIIMAISNRDIDRRISSINKSHDENEIVLKSLQLWKDTKRTNKQYSNLLNLIGKLNFWFPFDGSDESSVSDVSEEQSDRSSIFDVSEEQSDQSSVSDVSKEKSDRSSVSNVSEEQSDKSAIFDAIKDEIEKLFDM
ncbi:unnamed protein product [Rotaria socialis]|uniref:Protein kinase domain-containing protein n=1 Tax=Rotaria socialis TaxID=392032 RepID=A0A820ZBP2_9BILA|nr:unnamed protein product [Rotaria socialis]CAF4559540.1 unnamed protein product [Rotaria socialis]